MGLKKFIKKAGKQLRVNAKHAAKATARVMAVSATLAAISTGIVLTQLPTGTAVGTSL